MTELNLISNSGSPPIQQGGDFDEIAVNPINLQPDDEVIVAARLRDALTRR